MKIFCFSDGRRVAIRLKVRERGRRRSGLRGRLGASCFFCCKWGLGRRGDGELARVRTREAFHGFYIV